MSFVVSVLTYFPAWSTQSNIVEKMATASPNNNVGEGYPQINYQGRKTKVGTF